MIRAIVVAVCVAALFAPGADAACPSRVNDLAFLRAAVSAESKFKSGITAGSAGAYTAASAYTLRAWRQIRNATVPCRPTFRRYRTYTLKSYAAWWRSHEASKIGDLEAALYWAELGNEWSDQALAEQAGW